MNDLQNKLWNIELLVEEIQKFPQTYKTILGDNPKNTHQTILRRKINNLCKRGDICKVAIPGTRFGKAILYCLPKDYHILIMANRTGSSVVYVFFDYEKVSKFYLKVQECWVLSNYHWLKINEEKMFFEGNALKFI